MQRSKKYVLTQIFFITSEAELDYYHQKVTIPITSRVTERLKTFVIGKYQENTEMVGIQGCARKVGNRNGETFPRKTHLLNFVNFSKVFVQDCSANQK